MPGTPIRLYRGSPGGLGRVGVTTLWEWRGELAGLARMTAEHRFVVDINVGRLATWLRVMGYDTVFPREGNDNDLVRIALREGRVR